MDAKILKAAVSAALRVTVSTTLIGCGGATTSNADVPANADGGKPGQATSASGAPKSSGGPVVARYPKPEPASGGKAGAGTPTGGAAASGAATGGATLGGMASTADAGSAGEPNGGSPDAPCAGAEVDACFAHLDTVEGKFGEPPADADKPCCEAVLNSLTDGTLSYVCLADLNQHFMQSSARRVCCGTPESWVHQACAPWGPPVPPELSLTALLEWEAAA